MLLASIKIHNRTGRQVQNDNCLPKDKSNHSYRNIFMPKMFACQVLPKLLPAILKLPLRTRFVALRSQQSNISL